MSPELITAVKERLQLGYTHEQISNELRAAGYANEMIQAALATAQSEATTAIPVADSTASTAVALPSFGQLLKDSFSYAWKKWSLIGWYILVFLGLGLSLVAAGMLASVQEIAGFAALFIVGLFGVVLLTVFSFAVQRVIAIDDTEGTASLKEGWQWAKSHFFWSGLWVLLLLSLIVQGATALLLIPYIVIGPFISFMLYAYILEDFKGLSSVFRARELGKGNWWPLLWRKVLGVMLIMLPVMVIVVVAIFVVIASVGMVTSFGQMFAVSLPMIVGGAAILVIFSLFATVWALRFNLLLFKHLAAARPVTAASGQGTDKWKYVGLAIVGLIVSFIPSEEEAMEDPFAEFMMETEDVEMLTPDELKDRARDLRWDLLEAGEE